MHTPTTESNGGVGAAAKHVAEHASSLARLEVQLALLEIKKKAVSLGLGVGMLVGAALFGLFLLAFVLAAITAAFALVPAGLGGAARDVRHRAAERRGARPRSGCRRCARAARRSRSRRSTRPS